MCLVGCNDGSVTEPPVSDSQSQGSPDGSEDSSPESVSLEGKLLFTNEAGKAAYTVVYPHYASDIIEEVAKDLCTRLTVATGATFSSSTDRSEKTKNSNEILIGATNREASAGVDMLGTREYVVKVDGKKIVIMGGSDYATLMGLNEFLASFTGDAPYIDEDLSITGKADKDQYLVAVTNRSGKKIDIYDLLPMSETGATKIKSLPIDTAAAGLNIRKHKTWGDVVIYCGSKYAEIMSYENGTQLWSTSSAADNAHGIELLPNDVLAVASSSGNEVRFFDIDDATGHTYVKVTLEDAHGVLWDPQNEVVWALGKTKLTAYKVTKANGTVSVTEDTGRSINLPSEYGHDIAPYYGDTDKLWVTTSSGVYIYKKSAKAFTEHIEGDDGTVVRKDVKGIGNFEDGSILTLHPDGALYEWTTQTINLYFKYGSKLYHGKYTTLGTHYYKCRVVRTDYQ